MSQQVTDPTLSLQELLQVQVQSLVQELPHAASAAKKKWRNKAQILGQKNEDLEDRNR